MSHTKEAKSILYKHKKRDSWFLSQYSVNAFEGCSCNCLYCYVRGSKYGLNMDDGLAIKTNALELLDKQLRNRAKKSQFEFVAVGTATDAYMHHEEKWNLTSGMLQLLHKHRFPVFLSTKCLLIRRDIELLKAINNYAILPPDLGKVLSHGLIVSVSISTLDESISNMLEAGAATPSQRLALISEFKAHGLLAGVNAMPLLPFISDTTEEMGKIIIAAKQAGADYILTGGLTLFGKEAGDGKTLYYQFLQRYRPELLPKYEQLYGSEFHTSFAYQKELRQRAAMLCKKHSIRNSILPV
ncbi:MAG TPA: radical SAM protein [Chitinophagaceae bacterium]|jgi:DNA repair photolyase|nr:radical SAM protein [Chitinophagaceae bacterium]